MTALEGVLRRIQSDLQAAKFEFAVVGALAVSIHTEPRFTRDADLSHIREGRQRSRMAHLPTPESGVARRGHLIPLKKLSRDDRTRPQDLIDLRALLEGSSSDDLELARDSLGLISARGYHRDRNLAVDFERLLKDFSGR